MTLVYISAHGADHIAASGGESNPTEIQTDYYTRYRDTLAQADNTAGRLLLFSIYGLPLDPEEIESFVHTPDVDLYLSHTLMAPQLYHTGEMLPSDRLIAHYETKGTKCFTSNQYEAALGHYKQAQAKGSQNINNPLVCLDKILKGETVAPEQQAWALIVFAEMLSQSTADDPLQKWFANYETNRETGQRVLELLARQYPQHRVTQIITQLEQACVQKEPVQPGGILSDNLIKKVNPALWGILNAPVRDTAKLDALQIFLEQRPSLTDVDVLALLQKMPQATWGREGGFKHLSTNPINASLNTTWTGPAKDVFEPLQLGLIIFSLSLVKKRATRSQDYSQNICELALERLRNSYNWSCWKDEFRANAERYVLVQTQRIKDL